MGERAKRVTRRRALTAAAGVGAGVALAGCTGEAMSTASKDGATKKQTGAGATVSGSTYSWKLQSTWPASDFHQVNPQDFARIVGEITGGRLRIEVLAAGAVVPPLEILDAVHKGLL
ncbi:MAG TPA: hypothetical protein VFY87_10255, partial [Geminicoccaceae bacterium]|nr:hypothetical protein [Geminicoccaceae bacterium]